METNQINKTTVLLVATLAAFVTPFMGSAVNVAIPAISSEFAATAIMISWIPTAYLLASAMFSIPLGRIADIYGLKRIFVYGIILFTLASLGAALTPLVELLIAARMFQGIGASMIFVTGLALITHAFPATERGKAIGINITVVYIGLVLGPVLGGLIIQYLGWRSLFFLMLPLGVLMFLLTVWKMRGVEWADCNEEKFDVTGSVIYSLSLLLVLTGFSQISELMGQIMVIGGILFLILFIYLQLKVEHPVLEIRLFLENRTFAFSNLATLISFIGTFAVVYLLSLYLQYIRGLNPQDTGLVLATSTVCMALVSPIAGRLSDKYNPRILASIGMVFTTLGLFIFTFLDNHTPFSLIILGMVIMGFGSGIFASPNTNAIMGSVKKKFFGVASATVSTMRLVGQTLSMGMVLFIFSIYIGAVQIAPSNYPMLLTSVQVTFIIATIFCFIAIFASLAGVNKEEKGSG
ncbi:MAG TPA: MFS transporter [Methanobacterium sp.]|jgi:EmrB/QacA subfamily drug resistance transporter|nr:MAG: MFS transporter [Methanobacterium sp.]HOI71021.1 MFS transporter [Methanobacterium sp.]